MNLLQVLDSLIIIPVCGLIGISLSLIGSISKDLIINQASSFIFGFILLILLARFDYRLLPKLFWFIYFFITILLVATIFGPQVRGVHRWLDIAGYRLQPSEVVKPLIIIILAKLLAEETKHDLRLFGKPLIFLLPFIILIFRQPDLGNVIVYLLTFFSMVVMLGLDLKYILSILFVSLALIPSAWIILKPYQKIRILSFINPSNDYSGAGYNALQAIIAIGSGQIFGLGLGRGVQSHLLFLPEFHTDFIFASLGEELGLIGALLLLVLYLTLFIRILAVSRICDDIFGKLLCFGVFVQLFIQVFVNIGMNLGLLPITGITLPLVSYGGSSIISTFIGLGLVLSVERVNKNTQPIVIK